MMRPFLGVRLLRIRFPAALRCGGRRIFRVRQCDPNSEVARSPFERRSAYKQRSRSEEAEPSCKPLPFGGSLKSLLATPSDDGSQLERDAFGPTQETCSKSRNNRGNNVARTAGRRMPDPATSITSNFHGSSAPSRN